MIKSEYIPTHMHKTSVSRAGQTRKRLIDWGDQKKIDWLRNVYQWYTTLKRDSANLL